MTVNSNPYVIVIVMGHTKAHTDTSAISLRARHSDTDRTSLGL